MLPLHILGIPIEETVSSLQPVLGVIAILEGVLVAWRLRLGRTSSRLLRRRKAGI